MTSDSTGDEALGTLVTWEEGIGDERRYHIAHVSTAGITLLLKSKDYQKWQEAVAAAKASPNNAAAFLQRQPHSVQLDRSEIAKVTYAKDLNQFILFPLNQKKIKLPMGKEQADIFAAVKQHLGGSERQEEADAWSVMQSPLFVVAVIGVIGGFFIWFTTICEPNYEATGRRAGMKQLMNSVGYAIGPFWMSIIVGALAAMPLALMTYQLIKRPVRQILDFESVSNE